MGDMTSVRDDELIDVRRKSYDAGHARKAG